MLPDVFLQGQWTVPRGEPPRCYSVFMAPSRTHPGSRRLLIASLVLGVFVLLDLALLGWLIFRSLSEREVERVLLETREEAESLARRLAGRAEEGGELDLYTVTAMEREIQIYIDSVLKQREFVESVEVLDAEGKLVFRGKLQATFELDPETSPSFENREVPLRVEHGPFERQETYTIDGPVESIYDLDVPIGKLGFLHVGISRGELQKRLGVLRGELIRKTQAVGVVTVGVLSLAYFIIWWLWRRARKMEEMASEAERMAYIGTLASGLAHEIRNPLNSLHLNMQLLEEELGEDVAGGEKRRLLAITRDEIGRLERLASEFLRYAKPGPLDLEEIPAFDLLARCRELLAAELKSRGASLSIEDRSQGARVLVDSEQMSQLLLNLVQNALAASEEARRAPEVTLRARRAGSRVVLEVEDHGIGIPPEERGKIFDLFYSTRKGGTGLGLAVVERIAKAHNGEIEVKSTTGRGTTVILALPALRHGAQVRSDRASLEPSAQT